MTASVPARARTGNPAAAADSEFDLVESTSGWRLTITLTERLRQALAGGDDDGADVRFAVRIAPNLVPGEPFEASLSIHDPEKDNRES
jgi:hypothetical protein